MANKTQKTEQPVQDYIDAIEPAARRADIAAINEMMRDVTGWSPKMWGPSIVGFGDYHYKYESGREGDFFRIGYSSRAKNISIYIMPGYQDFDDELSRLGKHSKGKSCLYIKRLSDVDSDVLREMLVKGLALMEEKYPL
ncbi:DUF1801 domain-containing protein [Fretibacter rubidus]|uniref:DUF1801 domain-containing protein n=1 Tax=Fretibacter rubidus TaxID=570162 RepID=UPI00352A0982